MPNRRVLTVAEKSKRQRGLCIWFGCGDKKAPRKVHCCKHYHQDVKLWRPLRYCYENVRIHARVRGKNFKLTFKDFCIAVSKTDYLKMRGRAAMSLTIDRIDNNKGYVRGNIQVITLSENASKGNRMMYVPFYRNQMQQAGYAN